jgi:hypothetical protein
MKLAPRRRRKPVVLQAAELAFAAPQVVAHRVARMAGAGLAPGLRDRREFHRMGSEKVAAFAESWMAMTFAGFRAQQDLTLAIMRAWNPVLGGKASAARLSRAYRSAALAVTDAGLAPIHRRAVANAKRLRYAKR